jgi:bis(5'-nucleosidyl)-tetraphosphatase
MAAHRGAVREAAGVVLARQGAQGLCYLLLRNAMHGTWAPPKGHLESGEGPAQGALRELAEETGIRDARLLPGFQHVTEYEVSTAGRRAYRKRVTWYAAWAPGEDFSRGDEHSEAGWFRLEDALTLAQHDQTREVLRAAHQFLLAQQA